MVQRYGIGNATWLREEGGRRRYFEIQSP